MTTRKERKQQKKIEAEATHLQNNQQTEIER